MKKVILKVDLHDDRLKVKAMKSVSGLQAVDSIGMDMKEQKMTVIGDVDPVDVVNKLRKLCRAEIIAVGPAKEEKKKEKEEPKKDKEGKEPEKEEPKKEDKEKGPKKEEPKKDEKKGDVAELMMAYQAYNPYTTQQYYVNKSAEEDPNACVIC